MSSPFVCLQQLFAYTTANLYLNQLVQPFLSTIFVYSTNFCVQPLNQPFSSHFHPPIFATHTYFFFANNFFNLSFSATFNNHFLLLIQPSCNQPILPIIFQPFLCAILLNNLHSHSCYLCVKYIIPTGTVVLSIHHPPQYCNNSHTVRIRLMFIA